MSRPISVKITRTDPNYPTLVRMFKKEKNGDRVRKLHALVLMYQWHNAERVAQAFEMESDTIRHWVQIFNEEGLEGLFKKKDPADPAS